MQGIRLWVNFITILYVHYSCGVEAGCLFHAIIIGHKNGLIYLIYIEAMERENYMQTLHQVSGSRTLEFSLTPPLPNAPPLYGVSGIKEEWARNYTLDLEQLFWYDCHQKGWI